MSATSRAVRLSATGVVLAATSVLACTPAFAAGSGSGVDIVNTETVQIYTNASGKVSISRVYEQLTLTGNGEVDLDNPTATSGVRNLDGFGGADASDGEQHVQTTVDGEKQLRTVADFDGKPPLTLAVAYELDGKSVEPGDVVGESGELQVTYTVKNVSAVPTELTFDDGLGGTVTKTVDVPIPLVGSLTTVAPPSFTEVTSDQANMAGDGKGGTKMSFTMTLIPPIGSDTATFGYTAQVVDGVIPRAEMSVLPVDPLQSPSFKGAATSYQGGADTGVQLTGGATEIDSNLLKLRDGAGDLLGGLIKLRDGADQLSEGLTDTALPGAEKLAAGATKLNAGLADTALPGSRKIAGGLDELRDGLTQTAAPGARKLATGSRDLSAGLGKIDDGATKLSAGAASAADGGTKVAAGAKDLSNGVKTLNGKLPALDGGAAKVAAGQQGLVDGLARLSAGVSALPASVREQLKTNADYQRLLGALTAVVAGIGSPGDDSPATLLGGLNGLEDGLDEATTKVDAATERLNGALNGPATADGTVARLRATISSIKTATDCGQVCQGTVDRVADGVGTAQTNSLTTLRDGLVELSTGIKTRATGPTGAIAGLKAALNNGTNPATCDRTKPGTQGGCGIAQVLQIVSAGVPAVIDGVTTSISTTLNASIGTPTAGCDPTATLRCAAGALNQGSKDLAAGIGAVVGGVGQLDAGGLKLATGASDLATGLGTLSAGSKTLADGADTAAAGSQKLAKGNGDLAAGIDKAADGSDKLADGSDKLAAGLGTAADGSQKIADGNADLADGLGTAADGSTKIADGLTKAAGGAPQLVDGAQQLSDQGTQKLVAAGESTAQNYGEMYATLAAGAERANTEKMVFGAPEGASGLTAYSYVIQGEDGDSGRNLTRGLAGLALLGAGAGVVGLRRRLT